MANYFTNPNQKGFFSTQPGGLFGPSERGGLGGYMVDPRFQMGYDLTQGKPIGEALIGGYIRSKELETAMFPEADERKIIEDADGRQRYVDTGEYVFPDLIERQDTFKEKLASGEEISEADLAEAYPQTYAEHKIKENFAKQDPLSKIGKINKDYFNGDMTKDQYEKAIQNATGQKEFAPGEIEKDVSYLKTIFTDKTDAELATQVIGWKTTLKAPTKEAFMGEAYTQRLKDFGSSDEAQDAANEAGKYWDLNLSDISSAKISINELAALQAEGYSNFSFENGKIYATKNGKRGEITFE